MAKPMIQMVCCIHFEVRSIRDKEHVFVQSEISTEVSSPQLYITDYNLVVTAVIAPGSRSSWWAFWPWCCGFIYIQV